MNFETWFHSRQPTIAFRSAQTVMKLAEEGATVPFMARYRKEQTGNLDEVAIQAVLDEKERFEQIVKRQAFIVGEIEAQKKLTPEIKDKILGTFSLEKLEDLYLPFKQKRKTKAGLAKEAGLEPLADWIWNCGHGTEAPQPGQTLELWALTFRNEEKGITEVEAVIQGAQDILVERISESAALRDIVRQSAFKEGGIKTGKGPKPKPNSKFEKYFDAFETVPQLLKPENSHRYLAIRRGWIEEELTIAVAGGPADLEFENRLLHAFDQFACTAADSPGATVLAKAARVAFKAYVFPAIENEVHKALKEVADKEAIDVFAKNLRRLLMAAPYGAKTVLGIDPGIRTGCKVALVDESGKYVGNHVFQIQSDEGKNTAKVVLAEILKHFQVQAIAVGNGTGGRDAESFLRKAVKELGHHVPVVMVNEAGASVYSASEVAREEFPELDLTIRGAISIARRLQDPLAELVKIDPKSIGVGQYQHDVSPHALKKSLEGVVDSAVHSVGVNLNTASYHLLARVSGIGPALAKSIVERRTQKGLFTARTELQEIPHFGGKTFELAAGFLRIPGGTNPLDNTGVHPERYGVLEAMATKFGKQVGEFVGGGAAVLKSEAALASEVGEFTLRDIIAELEKPGRDPREAFVLFQYRDDIFELKDLQPGMMCPGVVTNVTNFGAFVDIGVHQDGLVHLSQLANRFVKDPREVVNPGDRVMVKVLEVNLEKNQISFTMKSEQVARKPAPKEGDARPQRQGGFQRRPDRKPADGQVAAKGGGGRPHGGQRPAAAEGGGAARAGGPPSGNGPATAQGHGHRPQGQGQGQRSHGGGGGGGSRKPQRAQFSNNPFAVLADLKKDLNLKK